MQRTLPQIDAVFLRTLPVSVFRLPFFQEFSGRSFKDSHGTGCSLCRAIALEGERQATLGTPVAQIKRMIDERYAPRLRQ